MSVTLDFYLARAEEMKRDAANATLANVRDRCVRAEAAWREMAARVQRGDEQRETIAAEKAARDSVA